MSQRTLEILVSTIIFMTGNDGDIIDSYVSAMTQSHDGVKVDDSLMEELVAAQDEVKAILKDMGANPPTIIA